MTNFTGMTHAIFKLLLWQMLMQSTVFPEGFLSFIFLGEHPSGSGFCNRLNVLITLPSFDEPVINSVVCSPNYQSVCSCVCVCWHVCVCVCGWGAGSPDYHWCLIFLKNWHHFSSRIGRVDGQWGRGESLQKHIRINPQGRVTFSVTLAISCYFGFDTDRMKVQNRWLNS